MGRPEGFEWGGKGQRRVVRLIHFQSRHSSNWVFTESRLSLRETLIKLGRRA